MAGYPPPEPPWDLYHYCTQCDFRTVRTTNGPSASDIQQLHRLVCPKAEIRSGFVKGKRLLSSITDADAKEHIRRHQQVALNQQLATATKLQDFFSREVARLKEELAKLG